MDSTMGRVMNAGNQIRRYNMLFKDQYSKNNKIIIDFLTDLISIIQKCSHKYPRKNGFRLKAE